MAQDSETTRAQVKKRNISNPGALPKLTRKPQPRGDLPAITRKPQPDVRNMPRIKPVPQTHLLSKHPQKYTTRASVHDYSHSGGEVLNRYRRSKAHQEHLALVKLARNILSAHTSAPSPGVAGDTKSDADRLTADAYKYSNTFRNALNDAREAHGQYLEDKAAAAKKAENDKYSGSVGGLALGFINMKGPIGNAVNSAAAATGKAAFEGAKALGIETLPAFKSLSPSAASDLVPQIAGNFGKELVDLPANAVPSLYYAGEPLVRGVAGDLNPALRGKQGRSAGAGAGETARRLAEPYVNLAKNPAESLREHPLSTALMIAGPLKAADRIAGRVEQGAYPHRTTNVTAENVDKLVDHPEAPKAGTPEFKRVIDKANKAAKLEDRGSGAGERAAGTAAKNRILSTANLEQTSEGIRPKQIKSTAKINHTTKSWTTKPSNPYEHIEIRLPGTAAKQVILPRQGALAYRLQKSRLKDVPRMSDKEINRRVDETFYTALNQSRQDAYDAIANHQHNHPSATPEELESVAKDQLKKSRDFYRDQSALDLALRDKDGVVRKFHGGKFDDATNFIEKWGRGIVDKGLKAKVEEYTHNDKNLKGIYHSTDAHTLAPYILKTGPSKGKTILAPKTAIDQLAEHDSYLRQTTTSAVLQGVGGTFRRTVLPFSPKWLANNYTEAALRGAINGVGVGSKREANSFYSNLSEGGKKEFDQLVKSVGHGGMQRQLLQEGTNWETKLRDTRYWKFGESITKMGKMPGPKQARFLMDKWTDVAFHDLNGRMENQVHMGMAGKVLKRYPLMSERTLKVTHAAMNPEGKSAVEQRNNLIALGREVDRMFGKYGKFSPDARRSIATWTPFIPWTLNAVHFVTQHLPNDHPVVTALIADAHQASEEWRKKHGLGNFIDGKLPPFLQGAIPGSNGSHWMIFSQGTPFSVAGDPTGTLANNFNPLGSTIQANLEGLDWKGDKLKNDNPGVRVQTAILSALEGTTPIGYATNRITGGNDGSGANIKKWANPFHPVKGKDDEKSKSKDIFSSGSKKKSHDPFAPGSKKKNHDPFAP